MLNRPVPQKIRPDHLDRLAVIYVRQSTLFQVRENTGSTTRQYDLVKRAGDLVHRSPRDFGLDTSMWTLPLVARMSFQQGLTPRLVSGESVRRALKRLGKSWKRTKHWITSPDAHYLLKKPHAIG